MFKKILVAATILGVAAVPAVASPVGPLQRLHYERGGTATSSWTSATDSPLDTNSKALAINVPVGDYEAVYNKASLSGPKSKVHGESAGEVRNLSFDVRTSDLTAHAGSPRISVIFNNGDVAYLSAAYCASPIAVSGGTWSRADFTGGLLADGVCQMYVTGATGNGGVPYSNTATQSVWDVYAAANPTQVVDYLFFVVDESGTYVIDRLSLGTGKVFGNGTANADPCVDENDC